MKNNCILLVVLFFVGILTAQTSDTLSVKNEGLLIDKTIIKEAYEPLAPARAAFYSAVLPGLGQAYNKQYWKIPVIYAGMATGVYFYIDNNNEYNRLRDAYKRRLAGFEDDEFFGTVSLDRLEDAQETAQKNKNVSIIVALAFYLANIIDANVGAHLRQFNVNEDLTLSPNFEIDPIRAQPNYTLSLKFNLE